MARRGWSWRGPQAEDFEEGLGAGAGHRLEPLGTAWHRWALTCWHCWAGLMLPPPAAVCCQQSLVTSVGGLAAYWTRRSTLGMASGLGVGAAFALGGWWIQRSADPDRHELAHQVRTGLAPRWCAVRRRGSGGVLLCVDAAPPCCTPPPLLPTHTWGPCLQICLISSVLFGGAMGYRAGSNPYVRSRAWGWAGTCRLRRRGTPVPTCPPAGWLLTRALRMPTVAQLAAPRRPFSRRRHRWGLEARCWRRWEACLLRTT